MTYKTILFVAGLVVFGVSSLNNSASSQSLGINWFDSSKELELTLVEENAIVPASTYWGIPCVQSSGYTMTYSYWGQAEAKIASNACGQTAPYGVFTENNKLRLAGTNTSYRLMWGPTVSAMQGFFTSIPNTDTAVHFNDKMSVYHNFPDMISPVYSSQINRTGQLDSYNINPTQGVDYAVRYSDGTELKQIKANGFSFAKKGRRIALNIGAHQALVDTNTRLAKRFGKNSIASGSSSTMRTSLNSDGSVVITSNVNPSNYTLYDLNNCVAVEAGKAEACPERNFGTVVRAKLGLYVTILDAKFVADDTIELYVQSTTDGITKTHRYALKPQNIQQSTMRYLALGDSYASGEGAYSYKSGTDISSNKCHLSIVSYPYLIATERSYAHAESVACSGAKLKDIQSSKSYKDELPQAQGKDSPADDTEIFRDFLPGYRQQIEFVEKNQPETITLSIGGNDIDFGKKLRKCILTPYNCYSSQSNRVEILAEIKSQFTKLEQTYMALKEASPHTRIYVLGYPEIALASGGCALNVRLSSAEINLAQDIVTDLNSTIKLATQKTGVFYVDVSQSMHGYRLCEDDPWKLAINGILPGDDTAIGGIKILGNETYHPNKLGHKLYKATILQETSNLTAPMPSPNPQIDTTELQSQLVPGHGQQSGIRLPVLSDEISDEIVKRGQSLNQLLSITQLFLKPNSLFQVELWSDPVVIGSATTEGLQQLLVQATIPLNTLPGAHTVHITGVNIDNEPIDIYKNIIVIASDDDYDGDGIFNSVDACQFMEPTGVDTDGDLVDDGCDAEITQLIDDTETRLPVEQPDTEDDVVAVEDPDKSEPQYHILPSDDTPSENKHTFLSGPVAAQTPRLFFGQSNFIASRFSLDASSSSSINQSPQPQLMSPLIPDVLGASSHRMPTGITKKTSPSRGAILIGFFTGLAMCTICILWLQKGSKKRR